ncbi:hypothetical protein [Methanobrevibacter sp.]|uniref:hypothetical protein n=1 Tax=Methanobrevibacter sp. TaxID=66852 RepID=UPI00260039E1|nr:hypothetical protein [Methanobrevibacter sp.]MBQ6511284.1 EI24 domain-containing protein [Methanobrevibacter sp.]
MNYKKIILVGFISAFVAILTSVLGVAGTVIGSVISSVLYNTLSEALEKPVTNASFKKSNFEWDIAYVFPLIVIAIIQLMLILALLAEQGILPANFLNLYLLLQQLVNNNLYRILGLALLVISVYPFVLKPENVNKIQGGIIALVGLIFLARGLVDLGNSVTDIYDGAFIHFDLEIAIFALVLLAIVIVRILLSAKRSNDESKKYEKTFNHKVYYQKPDGTGDAKRNSRYVKNSKSKRAVKSNGKNMKNRPQQSSYKFKSNIDDVSNTQKTIINESSENIQFESNDILEEYKKIR